MTCWQVSLDWPTQSGTTAVAGPLPSTIVISLVIAEVWLAGGTVDSTRSFCSGVEADVVCRKRSKPALVSLRTASA